MTDDKDQQEQAQEAIEAEMKEKIANLKDGFKELEKFILAVLEAIARAAIKC